MRNLAKYPISKEELSKYLEEREDEVVKSRVFGGIDGAVIQILQRIVQGLTEDDLQNLRQENSRGTA